MLDWRENSCRVSTNDKAKYINGLKHPCQNLDVFTLPRLPLQQCTCTNVQTLASMSNNLLLRMRFANMDKQTYAQNKCAEHSCTKASTHYRTTRLSACVDVGEAYLQSNLYVIAGKCADIAGKHRVLLRNVVSRILCVKYPAPASILG